MAEPTVSIVTPTFRRPGEVIGLLENISRQRALPFEIIIVDGTPEGDDSTESVIRSIGGTFEFDVIYLRRGGGTAIQRNHGIDAARGDYIAFVDDDVRLDPGFFSNTLAVLLREGNQDVGGVVGYRENEYFDPRDSERWRWYKRLGLLTIYEPGRYDFESGYPINNSMQAPFSGTRDVDFMTTACAVWRREVFDDGLRFDPFFRDFGVLEDTHLSLRAGRRWRLLQCGQALCTELRSSNGRASRRSVGQKCVANYYYVFRDIAGPLDRKRSFRFWRFQLFEIFRIGASCLRRFRRDDLRELFGRCEGILKVVFGSDTRG